MTATSTYTWLDGVAKSLEYPAAETADNCIAAAETLPETHAFMADALLKLGDWLKQATLGEGEEWYSRLFDLSPVCTLNIGYHLFGEQYERGAFLAGLVGEHRRAGAQVPDDLPDYLPAVLRLLTRIESTEDATLLVSHALLPALDRMVEEMGSSDAPWSRVIRELPAVLETTFDTEGIPRDQYPSREKTFLGQRDLPISETSMNKRRGNHHE